MKDIYSKYTVYLSNLVKVSHVRLFIWACISIQIDETGRSWRSGALVEMKFLRQWYLKLSCYADVWETINILIPRWFQSLIIDFSKSVVSKVTMLPEVVAIL